MGTKVLIVDDSMVARMAIKGALKDCGASLTEASTGEDALELMDKGLKPDVVFLDLTMPGIGGVETLRSLRRRQPGIRVVVVTADMQAQTLAEIKALEAFDVLGKPADKGSILSALNRATGGSPA